MTRTLAPQCAGYTEETGRCPRKIDDGNDDGRWLVLTGTHGQPAYFFCPECEVTHDEWIERNIGPEGQAAGCTGMVRLESGRPAEIFGMVRDIEDESDDEEEDEG
jgi:hypothetical protein